MTALAAASLGYDRNQGSRPLRSRAIAIEGGGFRSLTVAVVTTSGALMELRSQRGCMEGTLKNLLSSFGIVSSVSGGSWFASELMCTCSFVRVIELVSRDWEHAGRHISESYVEPLLRPRGMPHFRPGYRPRQTIAAALAAVKGIGNTFELGYLKAVWPDLLGAFLRSGRPRGPGKALTHILEGLPGAGQTSKMQHPKCPARLPSGYQ
jgi:hypothetical protein